MPTRKPETVKKLPRGQGSLSFNDDRGCFQIRFRVPGQRNASVVYGKTPWECERKRDAKLTGVPVAEADTVEAMFDRWYRVAMAGADPSTAHDFLWSRGHIVRHLGAVPLDELDQATVVEWLLELKHHPLGKASRDKVKSALSKACDHAVLGRRMSSNPVRGAKLPGRAESKRETPHLDDDDFRAVREYLVSSEVSAMNALCLTMLLCGLRPGEARALKWTEVRLAECRLDVHWSIGKAEVMGDVTVLREVDREEVKTSRFGDEGRRTVSMPPDLVDVLERQRRAQLAAGMVTKYVFAGDDGKFPSKYVVSYATFAVARATGTRIVTPNGYRHSFISKLGDSNMPRAEVKKIVGHKANSVVLETSYTHAMRRDGTVDTTSFLD